MKISLVALVIASASAFNSLNNLAVSSRVNKPVCHATSRGGSSSMATDPTGQLVLLAQIWPTLVALGGAIYWGGSKDVEIKELKSEREKSDLTIKELVQKTDGQFEISNERQKQLLLSLAGLSSEIAVLKTGEISILSQDLVSAHAPSLSLATCPSHQTVVTVRRRHSRSKWMRTMRASMRASSPSSGC